MHTTYSNGEIPIHEVEVLYKDGGYDFLFVTDLNNVFPDTVVLGDRADNIANQYYGDPEQSWQLFDANNIMHPHELTETIGKRINITLPEGIPGLNNG